MQYLAIRPNLELKTSPKQFLGTLPLDVLVPDAAYFAKLVIYDRKFLQI
jgi:hypothetical protein